MSQESRRIAGPNGPARRSFGDRRGRFDGGREPSWLWYARAVPGPFDTTLKSLIQAYPADWIAFLRLTSPGPVEVVDANLSTVTAEVDKVMRVGDATPWLVHLEFQSSYDPTIGQRLVRYSTLLHLQHDLAVESVLVLLRRSAQGPAITGQYRLAIPGRDPYLTFTYAVRRIWLEPAAELLGGALGTLPLVPLGATSPAALPGLCGLWTSASPRRPRSRKPIGYG
jgi:hypothetical protein